MHLMSSNYGSPHLQEWSKNGSCAEAPEEKLDALGQWRPACRASHSHAGIRGHRPLLVLRLSGSP